MDYGRITNFQFSNIILIVGIALCHRTVDQQEHANDKANNRVPVHCFSRDLHIKNTGRENG